MILPNKHLRENETLIGVGAALMQKIPSSILISDLWESVKEMAVIGNFERFVLGLDLLFLLDVVRIENNRIIKVIKNDL
jgi:hypothetical protein